MQALYNFPSFNYTSKAFSRVNIILQMTLVLQNFQDGVIINPFENKKSPQSYRWYVDIIDVKEQVQNSTRRLQTNDKKFSYYQEWNIMFFGWF